MSNFSQESRFPLVKWTVGSIENRHVIAPSGNYDRLSTRESAADRQTLQLTTTMCENTTASL